jgi:hypothetical protein
LKCLEEVTIIHDDNENINNNEDLSSHGAEGFTIYIHDKGETSSQKKHGQPTLNTSPMPRRFTQSMAKKRAKKQSVKATTPVATFSQHKDSMHDGEVHTRHSCICYEE